MNNKRIVRLLRRYLEGTASNEENAQVDKWYCTIEDQPSEKINEEQLEITREELYKKISARLGTQGSVLPMYRRTSFRIAAAACVAGAICLGIYLLMVPGREKSVPLVKTTMPAEIKSPVVNRAMITLSNGQTVYLDSAANGTLAMQGASTLRKLADGVIVYNAAARQVAPETQYNTLQNPKGSKVVSITLADGTRVYLNAASSIRYPATMDGAERKVELSGEAFFEVARNEEKPFIVTDINRGLSVTVLGTHFNVNSYPDELSSKVTLVEGSVKVNSGVGSGLLKPSEQVEVSDKYKLEKFVDVEEVMAWKDGRFQFGEKADISVIMRQLSRWYDVDVEYRGKITHYFGGSISRSADLRKVLDVLEATGGIKCSIEGKKVILSPR